MCVSEAKTGAETTAEADAVVMYASSMNAFLKNGRLATTAAMSIGCVTYKQNIPIYIYTFTCAVKFFMQITRYVFSDIAGFFRAKNVLINAKKYKNYELDHTKELQCFILYSRTICIVCYDVNFSLPL